MRRGKLLTFEGADGCGKTTISKIVCDALQKDCPCVWDTNPSTSRVGKGIRDSLQDNGISPQTFLFLFLADRYEHFVKYVRPWLDEGRWVLLDRFSDSTIAFQSFQCGVSVAQMEEWVHRFGWFPTPDRTYLLDVDYETLAERTGDRDDPSAYDKAGRTFQESVIQGYRTLAKRNPDRIMVLDGRKSIDALVREIICDAKALG